MVKRFIGWIFEKIVIDRTAAQTPIQEGEVYWCALGENIGSEQDGKGEYFRRPVLVLKKFNNTIFWGIPMTTKLKSGTFYLKVVIEDREQSAILSQLRVLDTKRLDTFIAHMSKRDFVAVRNAIIEILKI